MPSSVVLGTVFSAAYLMVQLQTKPYLHESDDFFALASSFSMLVLFLCCMVYKYDALTSEAGVIDKMSLEQREDYSVSSVLLSAILGLSVLGSLAFSAVTLILTFIREAADLRFQLLLAARDARADEECPITHLPNHNAHKRDRQHFEITRVRAFYFNLYIVGYDEMRERVDNTSSEIIKRRCTASPCRDDGVLCDVPVALRWFFAVVLLWHCGEACGGFSVTLHYCDALVTFWWRCSAVSMLQN